MIALDVARRQLDWSLRNDPRVEVIERRNAREIEPGELPFAPALATVDVSFISLTKILPAVGRCVTADGEILAMVKPQFELGPERLGKGGVVREAADRRDALRGVAEAAQDAGLAVLGFASSGLPGPKGNRETFIRLRNDAVTSSGIDVEEAIEAVEP